MTLIYYITRKPTGPPEPKIGQVCQNTILWAETGLISSCILYSISLVPFPTHRLASSARNSPNSADVVLSVWAQNERAFEALALCNSSRVVASIYYDDTAQQSVLQYSSEARHNQNTRAFSGCMWRCLHMRRGATSRTQSMLRGTAGGHD